MAVVSYVFLLNCARELARRRARAAKIDPLHMPYVLLRLTAVLLFRNCSLITPELLTKTKTWLGKVQYNEKLESH